MNVGRFATKLQYSMVALVFVSACSLRGLAQVDHSHSMTTQQHEMTAEQQSKASALLKIVRDSTERFKDVSVAKAEGYALQFGCVSGPDAGAMGLHFVNFPLVMTTPLTASGEIDATRPQIVLYEPTASGRLQLTGADYLILAEAWDKAHPGNPPQIMGQLFHYFESPNRFALPAFYTLHVWAWKESPSGAFVNWNHNISCESFNDPTSSQ